MASTYTSSFGGRQPLVANVTFRGNGYSTDPGREGDPALQVETPASTALLNEKAALDAQAAQDAANAAAEGVRGTANLASAQASAEGNRAASAIRQQAALDESEAYRIAAGTAGSNASLEDQATAITAYQQARQIFSTLGAQRADVASAGFAQAGSNLNLLRDSIMQGGVTEALTRLQGNINAGGYRAQQQASLMESSAAASAGAAEAASSGGAINAALLSAEGESQASQLLAQQYATAGVLATSQSANLAAALAANPADATTRATVGRGGIAPAGSTTGFAVRSGGSDPFLSNTTLVNPGYDAAYANDPFGDKAAAAATAPTAPASAAAPTQLYDARTGQAANNTTFSGSSGGTGTGSATIGPAATPSFVDESIITSAEGDFGSP